MYTKKRTKGQKKQKALNSLKEKDKRKEKKKTLYSLSTLQNVNGIIEEKSSAPSEALYLKCKANTNQTSKVFPNAEFLT